MYATSGLRKLQVLSLKFSNVDFSKRMDLPNCHTGEIRQRHVGFFNEETEKAIKESTTRHLKCQRTSKSKNENQKRQSLVFIVLDAS